MQAVAETCLSCPSKTDTELLRHGRPLFTQVASKETQETGGVMKKVQARPLLCSLSFPLLFQLDDCKARAKNKSIANLRQNEASSTGMSTVSSNSQQAGTWKSGL